jgi:hypothetical protein
MMCIENISLESQKCNEPMRCTHNDVSVCKEDFTAGDVEVCYEDLKPIVPEFTQWGHMEHDLLISKTAKRLEAETLAILDSPWSKYWVEISEIIWEECQVRKSAEQCEQYWSQYSGEDVEWNGRVRINYEKHTPAILQAGKVRNVASSMNNNTATTVREDLRVERSATLSESVNSARSTDSIDSRVQARSESVPSGSTTQTRLSSAQEAYLERKFLEIPVNSRQRHAVLAKEMNVKISIVRVQLLPQHHFR